MRSASVAQLRHAAITSMILSPEATAQLFASNNEELYSFVSDSNDEMNVLNVDIDNDLVLDNLSCKDINIRATEVYNAIDKLKRGKGG
jgi:hypothetical protein